MYSYFHKDKNDIDYFEKHLQGRLPGKIIDAHMHINLPEHVATISQKMIMSDWALEAGMVMSIEDARNYIGTMFPGWDYRYVAFPWPIAGADIEGNNDYIKKLIKEKAIKGLCTIRPGYSKEYIESLYQEGQFSGFKPYPYLANTQKGADISIFDFMPHKAFEVADKFSAPVLIHLPRAGRLADKSNIDEIRAILDKYRNVKLVIAHFGRCFNHDVFKKALEMLGEDVSRLWFDCAALQNPKVYELAFKKISVSRILYGSDLPIMLWHGTREWENGGYFNLCREEFSWNTHKYPEEERIYTFFVYQQINNILDVIGDDHDMIQAVFHDNAQKVYA